MKSIVLAEKPSVGKELARVLGCKPKSRNYCEGKDHIVTWAMGHLIELADPGVYNDKWKTWDMNQLPMLPEKMKHKVIKRTSSQFNTIKGLFNRKDVNNVIIATDAGREGELVARWIMRLGGWKGQYQRLWISSQTDAAIKDGFKNLKPGKQYDNLFRAAECRAEADWIIGLNVTRALTCKYDARLSAGRVQTPTLSIIVERENEIENFEPQAYWTVTADFGKFEGTWQGKNGVNRFKENSHANEIADKVRDQDGTITEVDEKSKTQPPPLAYDLTALQRDANKSLGFSAKKTLQTLQGLYERHKIVTYPRTDSRHITTDMVPTLKDRLRAISHTRYKDAVQKLLQENINPGKRLVDNKKVTDHHAIIPTEEKVNLDKLSSDERSLWDMIAKRFIAVLSPVYKYNIISITVTVNDQNFTAKGVQVIDRGWKKVSGSDSGDENSDDDIPIINLSSFKKGDTVHVNKVNVPRGFTKPPARYTEGTLLSAMENPSKFLKDKELQASIRKGGLGTPATRADIIEKLFSNFYIERNGKEIIPTSQGKELINIVPEQLKSAALTAEWELRLTKISEGKENNRTFSKDIRENSKKLVTIVKSSTLEYKPSNESKETCPLCGKKLLTAKDKKGRKMLVCRSRSCGYEEDDSSQPQSEYNNKKPSRKEQAIKRKYMRKYEYKESSSETFTLGDLLKASMEKDKNKSK